MELKIHVRTPEDLAGFYIPPTDSYSMMCWLGFPHFDKFFPFKSLDFILNKDCCFMGDIFLPEDSHVTIFVLH